MNLDNLSDFCHSLPETEEKLPFDKNTVVFYVAGMTLCASDFNDFESINVKCHFFKR